MLSRVACVLQPYFSPTAAVFQPYAALLQPLFSPNSALLLPYFSDTPTSTLSQSYFCPASALVQPQRILIPALFQPYVLQFNFSLTSALFQISFSPTSLLRTYFSPTSALRTYFSPPGLEARPAECPTAAPRPTSALRNLTLPQPYYSPISNLQTSALLSRPTANTPPHHAP